MLSSLTPKSRTFLVRHDFIIISRMIVRRVPISFGATRTLSLSAASLRDFKEGRKIVHGRHQLPYWQDRDRKQVSKTVLDSSQFG